MHQSDSHRSQIEARVLRALALRRLRGFHFAGRFLDADFQPFEHGMRGVLEPGPHCVLANGDVDLISLCIFFDIALGMGIRTVLQHPSRIATTNLQLRFNGVPRVGDVRTEGTFQGLIAGTAVKLGLSSLELVGGQGVFGTATGQFAIMPGRNVEVDIGRSRENPQLTREDLTEDERIIMARADAALDHGGPFISAFWGVDCRPAPTGATAVMSNGTHAANRLGHLQGGVQLGMAAITAAAALSMGDDWLLTSIDASYLRPGEGAQFRASSEVLHRGRSTAMVMTKLFDERDSIMLVAASAHALRAV